MLRGGHTSMTDRLDVCTGNGRVSNTDWQPLEDAGRQLLRLLYVHGPCRRDSFIQEHLDTPIPPSCAGWDLLSPNRRWICPDLPPGGN
jgi:hypothetical protein